MTMILALDSSTAACSVALWRDDAVAAHRYEILNRGHAEHLMPMVHTTMNDADQPLQDLDMLAVTIGPGAFTGLRIGIAAARGLALALNVPCVGVTTLECLSAGVGEADDKDVILTALDTKRGDLFAQVFNGRGAPVSTAAVVSYNDLAAFVGPVSHGGRCVVAGDAWPLVLEHLASADTVFVESAVRTPDAVCAVQIVAARQKMNAAQLPPSPVYLRPPDAEVPADVGGLRP